MNKEQMGTTRKQGKIPCFVFSWIAITIHLLGHVRGSQPNIFPRPSESRSVKLLDGIWDFRLSHATETVEKFYEKPLRKSGPVISMPVPSSYNDITTEKEIRDHYGLVWYEKKFMVPPSWFMMNYRIWLRFGGVNYAAKVWINGKEAMNHETGHLPFNGEITQLIKHNKLNRITVRVNNILTEDTIPQRFPNESQNDHGFTYAGIHRSVYLYTTPQTYIDNIYIDTNVLFDENKGLGSMDYQIDVAGLDPDAIIHYSMKLLDSEDQEVFIIHDIGESSGKKEGTIKVPNVIPWWPYLMNDNPGYLYTLKIELTKLIDGGKHKDVYYQPVGFRSLMWLKEDDQMIINGKPLYMKGVSVQEESAIHGQGINLALASRDFNLIKWIGANTFRTSSRPISEEIMDFADRSGIMIVNESPAVNIRRKYTRELSEKHLRCIEELVKRDRNRPSVIMWSIGSDLISQSPESNEYYKFILDNVSQFDSNREFTAIIAGDTISDNHLVQEEAFNIIGINRLNTAKSEVSQDQLIAAVINSLDKLEKTFFIAEYGIDTVSGMHAVPSEFMSEEYQLEYMSALFEAFDILKDRMGNRVIGEMTNFADYYKPRGSGQAVEDKSGIFTRERKPKLSAYLLRNRYWLLDDQEVLENMEPPIDIDQATEKVEHDAETNTETAEHVQQDSGKADDASEKLDINAEHVENDTKEHDNPTKEEGAVLNDEPSKIQSAIGQDESQKVDARNGYEESDPDAGNVTTTNTEQDIVKEDDDTGKLKDTANHVESEVEKTR